MPADARWGGVPRLLPQLSESHVLSRTATKERRLLRVREGIDIAFCLVVVYAPPVAD